MWYVILWEMGYMDFEVVMVGIDELVIWVFVVEDFVVKLVYVKVEVILVKLVLNFSMK